jgi:hypothetical protein
MEDEVKQSIMIALIALLALAMAAPTVLARSVNGNENANANGVAPSDAPGPVDVYPGDYPGSCDFPFRVEYSGKIKTIDRPGDILVFTSPGLDVTVTNLDNQENKATFNITGTIEQTTLKNGDVVSVARGRNFLIDPLAGTVIAIGDYSFVFDKNGNLIQPLQGKGQLIDVCAALQ